MATRVKNYPPNDLSRREKTRKEGKCQLCRKKVDLKDQYTVENDLENLKVVAKKNATRKGAEKMSHYCSDCKDKRIKQKQAWMDSTHGSNGGAKSSTGSRKSTTAKKSAAGKKGAKAQPKAAKAKGAKKATAKRVAKKPSRKAAAASSETEPF